MMRRTIAGVGTAALLTVVPLTDSASASTVPVDAPATADTDVDDEEDDDSSGNWGLFGLLGLAGLAGLLGRRRTTDYVAPSSIAAAPRRADGASPADPLRDDY